MYTNWFIEARNMAKPTLPTRGGSYVREPDGGLRRLTPAEEDRLSDKSRQNFNELMEATLAGENFSAAAVFDRLRDALGCESDAALAWVLGTTPQGISNRRRRNTVPFREAVFVAEWRGLPLDYLLTGKRHGEQT
jgi:hypothetical protein